MENDTPAIQHGYATYQPSLIERAWRGLGFRYHLGEEPEGADQLKGWMCTETRMRFSFADRLRLLLSGRLHIRLVQHLPVECEFSKNRLDWEIKAPGQ
jgi:hypothetical protein